MNRPSVKNLTANLGISEQQATVLRALMVTHVADVVLNRANKYLEAYGVEAVRDNDFRGYYADIGLLYVNTGDTYNTTLVYNTRTGTYRVIDLGTLLERAPEGKYL